MKRKIRETFDMIHADEELKNKTREFLAKTTGDYQKSPELVPVKAGDADLPDAFYTRTRRPGRVSGVFRVIPAVCCMLILMVFGGWQLYFKPVSVISIDINPSLELDVNRFDRVVDVKEYNEDGEKLAESLKILFMNYEDALEEIMDNESVQDYLAQDQVMSIVVAGEDEKKTQTVYSNVEECTQGQENTHCYHADSEVLEDAHASGLSYGKYMAYLELKELDPDISPGDVQGMPMREIRNRIEELQGNDIGNGAGSGTVSGNGNGSGSGNGAGSGTGSGNGNNAGSGNGEGNGTGSGNGRGAGNGNGNGSEAGVGTGAGNGYGMNGTGAHHQESYGEHGAGHGRRHRE
ncbi:MAG TPA: hypothetical protein H9911_05435 [Candidatus Mediterraneibacter tabaqchaliae]|uniref:Anti-sigma factor RsgI-like middle domain-containing protein n=1 Tax=Candidatus Mediterraneibacter tabaqchaliae TaxID=2838689 RepID=A0A9D2U1B8_9FIRM|nr:hypothetical protein [Candidatus Mediterraneibacter tabaqchaliae]